MVFAANVFLFGFLPAFLALYYLVPKSWRTGVIAVFSYVFYGWWRPDFVFLLWFSTVLDFTAGRRITAARERGDDPKGWLWLSVCANLGLLGYFKYVNWGVDSLDAVLLSMGAEPIEMARIILPVGISFYTFQTMSYTIDVYRGTAKPVDNIADFAAYVAMFPQLVAGPIVRYNSVAEQLRERTHSSTKFSNGALRLMIGFCKKVLVADSVAPLVDATFANATPTFADAWLGTFAYTVQLYYDFSGYSDMAIGLGLMMGFVFPENFDHPYTSRSITEFWRRWHISLSSWLRDYLYITLGGNRLGPIRTYVNLGLTMLLGGIWHGANWTFVLWGIWHGGLLALERRRTRKEDGVRVAPSWPFPVTLILVMIGWVVFRAPDVTTAFGFYKGMLGLNGFALSDTVAWQVRGWAVLMLIIGSVLFWVAPRYRDWVATSPEADRPSRANAYLVFVPLFLLGITRLAAQSYTPFLYFQLRAPGPMIERTQPLQLVVALLLPMLILSVAAMALGREGNEELSPLALEVQQKVDAAEPEVVIIGNSLSGGVEPEQLGNILGGPYEQTLSLTEGATGPLSWYAVLANRVFSSDASPKLVIIPGRVATLLRPVSWGPLGEHDTETLAAHRRSIEPVLDSRAGNSAGPAAWRRAVARRLEWRNGLIDGVKYGLVGALHGDGEGTLFSRGRVVADDALGRVFSEENTDHRLLTRVIPVVQDETETNGRSRENRTIEETLLPDLLDLIEGAGARLLVVRVPLSSWTRVPDLLPPEVERGMIDLLKARGAGYVDLSRADFDATEFMDHIHVNQKGQEHLTQLLADELRGLDLDDGALPVELPTFYPTSVTRTVGQSRR